MVVRATGEQSVPGHYEKSCYCHLVPVISRINPNWVTRKVFFLFSEQLDKTQKMAEAKVLQLSVEQSFSNPELCVTVGNVPPESILFPVQNGRLTSSPSWSNSLYRIGRRVTVKERHRLITELLREQETMLYITKNAFHHLNLKWVSKTRLQYSIL